jgi:thiamine-phosphate pyrophosphorylase
VFYYITDRSAFPGDEPARRRLLLEKIAEAANAGVEYIQLREKDLSPRELEGLASEAINIVGGAKRPPTGNRPEGAALLINSRTDVALAAGTDGVHLRSDDVAPSEVRAIWQCGAGTPARENSPRNPIVSVSCHSPQEVVEAAAGGADFAVFAPVFEKKGAPRTRAAGLDALREASRAGIPVLALGGVTLDNARSCFDAGATGIAGIRLFQENDIAEVVEKMRALLGG